MGGCSEDKDNSKTKKDNGGGVESLLDHVRASLKIDTSSGSSSGNVRIGHFPPPLADVGNNDDDINRNPLSVDPFQQGRSGSGSGGGGSGYQGSPRTPRTNDEWCCGVVSEGQESHNSNLLFFQDDQRDRLGLDLNQRVDLSTPFTLLNRGYPTNSSFQKSQSQGGSEGGMSEYGGRCSVSNVGCDWRQSRGAVVGWI